MEQLSPGITTTEPECCSYWSPRAESPCSATSEVTTMRSLSTAMKSSPLLVATTGKPVCCNEDPTQPKKKKNTQFFLMNKIRRFLIKRIDYPLSSLTANLWVQRTPVETRGCANHTKQRGTWVLRLQTQAPLVLSPALEAIASGAGCHTGVPL